MKIISSIFNFASRHYREARIYENGKVGIRVLIIIWELILVIGTSLLEFFNYTLFNQKGNEFIYGILLFIVTIGLFFASLEINILYIILGFKMAIEGTLTKFISKGTKKKDIIENDEIKEKYKYKTFDYIIGSLSILFLLINILSFAIFLYSIIN